MSSFQPPGQAEEPRIAPQAPAQLLAKLRQGTASRLQPLLGATLAATDAQLRSELETETRPDKLEDDLTNLAVLRGEVLANEKRWQARIDAGFAQWPHPSKPRTVAGFDLVSEDDLQTQLVGQPVAESLERRFADSLEVIGSRLWSLAASLGGQTAPTNPIGPRQLVDCFLDTCSPGICTPTLRSVLVRNYERLAGEQLGAFYAWANTLLSDAGYALSGASDYAMLMGSPMGRVRMPSDVAKVEVWSSQNALAPVDTTRREGRADVPAGNTARGNALRERVGRQRQARAGEAPGRERREFGLDEFLAVLALLQGEAGAAQAEPAVFASTLRRDFADTAAQLGMSSDTCTPSQAQEAAIDLIGELFAGLATHHDLSGDALGLLTRMAPVYLRLALAEPRLFDDPAHPAMVLLATLVQCWDANHGEVAQEGEMHALADEAARQVVAEFDGHPGLLERVLARLQQALEALGKRANLAERRAWQTIQGRERLRAARIAADDALRQRLQQPLLAGVASFLTEQWRLSLVHAWLRDGEASERFTDALEVGDAIVRIDREAALASGHAVAEGLLALEQPLRECYVACGLDERGANSLLAGLVAEIAHPDARRDLHGFTPLAADAVATGDADPIAAEAAFDASRLEPGQVFILVEPGRAAFALHLAGYSTMSGASLLVDRQGMPQRLLSPAEFGAMLASGSLIERPACGPVEGQLRRMMKVPD